MNTNILMAKFAIAKAKKPSTTELILSEILSLHPNNIIPFPPKLAPTISANLNISHTVFRIHLLKLYKLNLIAKHGNTIIINPTIRKAFS